MLLDRVTEQEIRHHSATVALLPLGATEGHGRHLPYGADTFIAAELARRVAERYPGAVVVPALPYGMSWHHEDAPLTLSLSPETLTQVIIELLEGLVRHGVTRILIINGHDGNTASIEAAARRIRRELNVTVAALEEWWTVLPSLVSADTFSEASGRGGHAGEPETALAMAAVPDLVRVDRARPPRIEPDVTYTVGPGVKVFTMVSDHHFESDYLDASHATKESGEQAMEGLVDYLVRFLHDAEQTGWTFGLAARRKTEP